MTTTTTMTTKQQTKLISEARIELRQAQAAERQAIDADCSVEIAWRFAARCDKAARKLEAARAGIVIAAPVTKRSKAQAAFAALASIGRTFARIAATKAALIKAQAANVARKAARAAASVARQSLRRVVSVVVMIALFLATHSNINSTKEENTMKNTKSTKASKSTKNEIVLNIKERVLLRELQKLSNGERRAVAQSDLFVAFERKDAGKAKAKNHERAGWAVRNSSRKLIAAKLAVRSERGTLKLTNLGLDFVASKGGRS